MSEPIEKMLDCLTVLEDGHRQIWGHEVDAIRALILAVEEWKDGAKEIKDVIYEGEDWDIASSLIREIRDFGEENNENPK